MLYTVPEDGSNCRIQHAKLSILHNDKGFPISQMLIFLWSQSDCGGRISFIQKYSGHMFIDERSMSLGRVLLSIIDAWGR